MQKNKTMMKNLRIAPVFLLAFGINGQVNATVLIEDDFNDSVIAASKWITGGSNVTEHDGILDIQQNVTDAGGWAKTVEFTPAKKLRLEIEHTMHTIPYEGWPWGSYYYFPHFAFESTQPEGNFAVQWHRSDYPSDYCNDENYHNKVSIGGFGGCYAASNLTSSDYYDRKIKSVITYDSLTGDIKLDIGGDGTVDFSAVAPADKRFPIKQVHIGGYGWWTGHYHQIDSFKLESLDNPLPSPSKYDLSVGGTVTINPDRTRNEFWFHDYYQPINKKGAYICGGTHGATHTGRDTHTEKNTDRRLNKIRSYGFGRVEKIDFETSTSALTYISITHLLNSGETVQANLLHGLYDNSINKDDYIVKKQLLGTEDNKGAGPVHLHTEIASKASLAWICTSNAVPSSDGTINPKPDYSIDNLSAHYDKNIETLRYYSPDDTFNNHLELLPWLSTNNPSPSFEDGYSVYGIANQPLYGQLNLKRTSAKNFKAIGMLIKGGTDRAKPINVTSADGKWLARTWLGDVEYNDVSVQPVSVAGDYPVRGNHSYVLSGDYLAFPFVSETGVTNVRGYPVIFSILDNQNSKIIDNDKKFENGSTIYSNTGVNKQKPGYYLSSDIALGKSGATSKWLPNVIGIYKLSIFIPETTGSKVVYKVKTKGKNAQLACVIQDKTGGSWASLVESPAVDANGDGKIDVADLSCTKGGSTESPTEFNFSENGYVVVSLLKEPALGKPPLLVGDNAHLGNTNQVSFDAVKFDFVRE